MRRKKWGCRLWCSEMFVEKLALRRGEVKAQFSLLQDGGPSFIGVSFQGFGHPGEGFFQFG